jgi:DNA-binding transcriptional regulator YhcF (GntR family)
MVLELIIMNNSKVELVKEFILKEVKAGRIKNGQCLPSCRKVSSHLSVNKITVNKAYRELEK